MTRDAIAMSWKYAATEIYSLLSDVRDTDAEEMNVSIHIGVSLQSEDSPNPSLCIY